MHKLCVCVKTRCMYMKIHKDSYLEFKETDLRLISNTLAKERCRNIYSLNIVTLKKLYGEILHALWFKFLASGDVMFPIVTSAIKKQKTVIYY